MKSCKMCATDTNTKIKREVIYEYVISKTKEGTKDGPE